MRHIGLDAGSVSVKLVALDPTGKILEAHYRPHKGRPVEMALELLRDTLPKHPEHSVAITGSAGRLIAGALGLEPLNEIVAQAHATARLYPHIRTVIEMGGEDSKLIQLSGGAVDDFSMNSVCAAGTGSFLDQQAERLKLTIEELGQLASRCKKPPRIAGRCSVFAKSDMIHLQQIATSVEDIVAGLCFAVARNFNGCIVRGRNIEAPVAFQGGVAANPGMVRAFREVMGLDELFVPEHFALMGALGAALRQMDEGAAEHHILDLTGLEKVLMSDASKGEAHKPLRVEGDSFFERHIKDRRDVTFLPPAGGRTSAYMGIDIGSISTNLALVDTDGKLLAKRYLMTAGRPIEAVRQGLIELEQEIAGRVDILGMGTTGSGRYMVADYFGADIVKNEITAQATAAAFIDPEVDTIFEIGGQDSKYISLRDGVIVDFEMNKACAAGTGSFLEEQAEKLGISIKDEFAQMAFGASAPTRLGERCTVFMENSLMANLQRGAETKDLLSGLTYSIVQNYINRVVAGKPVGKRVFFQGGTAFNKAVVAAFEKHLGLEVIVPPNHDVTGAIGMALISMRHMLKEGRSRSTFKGWERARTAYSISSFECNGCPNLCEINSVKIEGEDAKLRYGGRCEKYDVSKKDRSAIPDLFKERDALLWKEVREPRGDRPRIGLPYTFFMSDLLPFWSRLLEELGFDVEVSPRPDRRIVELGLQSVLSESCYPVKVAIGHMRYLKENGLDAMLVPSYKNMGGNGNGTPVSLPCPHTQSLPYVGRVTLEDIRILAPVLDYSRGPGHMASEIRKALAPIKKLGTGQVKNALKSAWEAQDAFDKAVKARGKEVLESLGEKSVVIVGRAYNSFERGMNLQIPEKLASLGVLAIPMDMLPTEGLDITTHWSNMYWRSGQGILKAAQYMAGHPLLYPIFIGNFSCGPDSFILKYFAEELRGKPYLHIEIDEHSADAGAITRCEAFLDSISHRVEGPAPEPPPARRHCSGLRRKKVWIPRMTDHSLALKTAFENSGIEAELLPESTKESVELAMRYVSGKECYPCLVTTGDMLLKASEPGFDPASSAFFMPSGSGPCRFGQYNVFHTSVLERAGLGDVPVYAPNQNVELYRELGEVGKNFVLDAWKGISAVGLLEKCLHETRPYEKEPGSADALYEDCLKRLYFSLRGMDGKVEDMLSHARREFEALPADRSVQKPLIGLVGEIFVRTNRFSNEDLIRKIEEMGGEVWLATVEEWFSYINAVALRHAFVHRDFGTIVFNSVKRVAMDHVEHKYVRRFKGFLMTADEPTTKEVMEKAAPYVDDSFEGETVLSIGKAVDLAENGASGIVNAIPFGCMPGTIVSALLRAVGRDYGVPYLNVPYDGTESSTMRLQLEAFMDQTHGVMARRRK